MKCHLIFLIFLFLPSVTFSQTSWQQQFREWMTVEDVDYSEDTFELLSALAENKLDLNQASREDFEQFPFLSAQQIEELVAYIDRYKPLRSINELLMIESLDRNTRHLFQNFVFVGDAKPQDYKPTLSSVLKDGHHTLMGTVKIPMYERKGDRTAYLGYRSRHDFRYQYAYKDRIKFGLTGAQDSGEPFLSYTNSWGYDYYSYYFQLRRFGRLDELNLGMYRVQMGMGLVMNTGFRLGKVAILQSLGRGSHVLTAHASRSSSYYLRGVAATLHIARDWSLTAFASYRPLDATLNDDGTARTIVTDGYHRTKTELEKKNNTHLADIGFRMGWKHNAGKGVVSANLNAVYSHSDRTISPYDGSASQRYRLYALAGTDFLNASVDYSYTNHRLSFSGETAMNRQGALATLHTLGYRLTDEWSLMLLHRYYDKRYTAYHAYAFSEGGSTQNEHGLYLGAKWSPSGNTLLQAYIDYVHFPWARYQVSTGSESLDALVLARSLLYNMLTVEGRYRFHLRQRDNDRHNLLQNRYEHRARLRALLSLAPSLTLATQADAALVDNRTAVSRGLMLTQQVYFQHRWLQLSANVGWFHSDDYDSRLYQYEPSVLYDFSFPMYYGHGLRYALTARVEIGRLVLSAKFGTTNYFDRDVISSGNQQINRSSMTDLLLQLRVKL